MSLKTNKSISITGDSTFNGAVAVHLSATVDQEGNGNTNVLQNISNQSLYDQNKTEARKDIAEFQQLYYDTQDALAQETVVPDDTTSPEALDEAGA